jgi:hypothetical protein
MASPMVAGVVALILDANPYLMPQQVKDIIMQTAREDNYTQVIPIEGSPKWGAGKINAYAAVQLALITVGTNEIKQEKKIEIYPNPSSSVLNFKGDFIPNRIDLIDANGTFIKREIQNGSTSIADLKAGTYFVRFLKEGKVYQELVWFVSKPYRKYGIKLLKALENKCKQEGIQAIIVGAMQNSKAESLPCMVLVILRL